MHLKMKSLLAFLGLLACGCHQNKTESDVVSQRYVHKYGYSVPKQEWETGNYPGQVITTLRDGITITATYEGGLLHGSSTHTYPHSQIIETYYLYNQGNLVKEIVYDIKGIPLREVIQLSPTRHTQTLWYEDGSPLSIEEYVGRELLEGQYFTLTNELDSSVEKGNGLRTRKNREGSLLSRDSIESGYMVKREAFYPNGAPEALSYYHMDQLHGEQKNFAESGEPLSIVEWVHGELNGKCTYFKNGAKFLEISYLNNEKNGLQVNYTPDGIISQETLWENNKRHGPTTYHVDGNLHTEWYYDGREVSYEEFNSLDRIDAMISQMPEEIQIYR
jgi:antitoxin component YwqK of YwqJK toxin-antitoxin module